MLKNMFKYSLTDKNGMFHSDYITSHSMSKAKQILLIRYPGAKNIKIESTQRHNYYNSGVTGRW